MSIKDTLQEDIKNAMRAQDKPKLNTLRLIAAAVKQIEVDERIQVDDPRMLIILDKMSKQRKESIAQFEKAQRQDLIEQENYELSIINHYLPEPMSQSEIDNCINEAMVSTGANKISDMGKVMAELKPKLQGRVDMGKVSQLIKQKLGAA